MIATVTDTKIEVKKEQSEGVTVVINPSALPEKKEEVETKVKKKSAKKKKSEKIQITFVCTGNTCRSAMADAIFNDYIKRQKLKTKFAVKSRGLSAVEGDGMNPSAKAGLAYIDIPVPQHSTKQFSLDESVGDTLIVCMTARQKMTIGTPNAYSIGEITHRGDIPDPYGYPIEEYVKVAKYLRQSIGQVLSMAENLAKANKTE